MFTARLLVYCAIFLQTFAKANQLLMVQVEEATFPESAWVSYQGPESQPVLEGISHRYYPSLLSGNRWIRLPRRPRRKKKKQDERPRGSDGGKVGERGDESGEDVDSYTVEERERDVTVENRSDDGEDKNFRKLEQKRKKKSKKRRRKKKRPKRRRKKMMMMGTMESQTTEEDDEDEDYEYDSNAYGDPIDQVNVGQIKPDYLPHYRVNYPKEYYGDEETSSSLDSYISE